MAYSTENALCFAPGMILGELDCGGMVIDRNSGEYLPIDQVLKDPNHIEQLDVFDESHRGFLKLALCDDDMILDLDTFDGELGSDDSDDQPEEMSTGSPVDRFLTEQEELSALIAAQEADLMSGGSMTSTKGRHPELGSNKSDGGRLYKIQPRHGRNTAYKNRRRQPTAW